MTLTIKYRSLLVAAAIATMPATVIAQAASLPMREAPRPETTSGVPHVQIGVKPKTELNDALLARMAELPGVTLGPTRVSLPGAVGFQLDGDVELAKPDAIVGGREFAHLHPDGSLHASLDPEIAREAVEAGWAISHPWADKRKGWDGFVMIYTPQSDAELDVVVELVKGSYTYITGRELP